MKRFLLVVTLSLVAALFAFAQFGCAGPQPTTSTNTNMAIAEPTGAGSDDWITDAVKRFEADDAVFIYPDGSLGDKTQDVKDMESGALSAESWEIADLKVNVLGNDSAVVSGRSIVKGGKYKMSNGKTQDISGEYRWIDTYARRNGQWQLVAGATTPVMKGPAPKPTPSPSPSPSPSMKAAPAIRASPATKPSPAMKAAPTSSPAKTKTP